MKVKVRGWAVPDLLGSQMPTLPAAGDFLMAMDSRRTSPAGRVTLLTGRTSDEVWISCDHAVRRQYG